ncbi:hypothetical protein QL112_005930 [Xenorhabdus griffiniae]|uniref:Phage tail protein C-terminal domain-containing protein n=1 Tax=Xenorhabdus griffiniae TaxID=351672 RepID=A0ABY9XKU0_9GAMM|nr:hypothetical protein [Xenorhabdus griffiniae]WMV73559.1 hypothetical protein QL128_05925 [Xenorhabdus griffiniae]WNH03239.1 hypothetical protein QL112_005930 [Xenorhabdus griffiniae]
MLYEQGTISTVSGSAIVRGTGTKFISNINGVAPGQIILIQSGNGNLIYMIQAVNSDTELVLASNVAVTLNNTKYQIQVTVPDSASDAVRHIVANTTYVTQFLQNMDKWMSQNGVVDVTLPNGQTVSLQSIRALQAAMLDKNKNGADIPNKSEFVKNLGLVTQQWVIDNGSGFIQYKPIAPTALTEFTSWIKSLPNGGHAFRFGAHDGEIGYKWSCGYVTRAGDTWAGFVAHYNRGVAVVHGSDDGGSTKVSYLWTNKNAWKDSNGYLRASSPLIQIYPDGKFTTNDESEGATVTKLGIGHYQISGVLGYNADGAWGVHGGISSPKNNNGLELIYIDDQVQKDGCITIKTFHRQHTHLPKQFQNKRIKDIVDGEKVYYADAEPCDIPEGCRLDVRVQMPEDSVWNLRQGKVTEDGEQVTW